MGVAPSKTFSEAASAIVTKKITSTSSTKEVITLAGGCFWGIELAFQRVPGVSRTEVGYAQGYTESPSYEEVCEGTTGHAEVVQVTFDPAAVTLEELLAVFWDLIDPTVFNRQGNDEGTQYRTGIYCHTAAQLAIAQQSKEALKATYGEVAIATDVQPLKSYYRAEDGHQQYLQKGGQCARTGDLTPIRCYG